MTNTKLKEELQSQATELQTQLDAIIEPNCTHLICDACMNQVKENAKQRELLLFKIQSINELIEKL